MQPCLGYIHVSRSETNLRSRNAGQDGTNKAPGQRATSTLSGRRALTRPLFLVGSSADQQAGRCMLIARNEFYLTLHNRSTRARLASRPYRLQPSRAARFDCALFVRVVLATVVPTWLVPEVSYNAPGPLARFLSSLLHRTLLLRYLPTYRQKYRYLPTGDVL